MATRAKKKTKARSKPRDDEPAEPERFRRFVEAYMGAAAGDQGKAARLAGYEGTDDSMSERGRRLLLRDDVRAMIAARRAECPLVASREELQEMWTRAIRFEPVVVKDGKKKPVKVYPNFKEALRASELLGKAQGLFIEKKEVSINGSVEIVSIQLPDNNRGS